ncbi:flagellin [Bacillaceae bacterium]
MRINHNIAALNTYRQLAINNSMTAKSLEKLSSGLRINRAGDDAAGLAISEKMRGQIRGLEMASKNAQDGISLIQTAEGALNETQSILQRMRELAVQASNDTNTNTDRQELQKEIEQLIEEIDRIANTTEFNTKKLLNGDLEGVYNEAATHEILGETYKGLVSNVTYTAASLSGDHTYLVKITGTSGSDYTYAIYQGDGTAASTGTVSAVNGSVTLNSGEGIVVTFGSTTLNVGDSVAIFIDDADTGQANNSLKFQIGANSTQTMEVDINKMDAASLNVKNINVTSQGDAEAAVSTIEMALRTVSAERAKLGAFQNRLEHTINNLGTSAENLTAAESRIRDVDMAKEMMEFTKNNILNQAAQAMLAQANQQPQGVLQLLR